MDPRDDDIEFDFFEDEPATSETRPVARAPAAARRLARRRRPAPFARARRGACAASAPARARRLRDRPRPGLRAPDPVVREHVEARCVRELHGGRPEDRAQSTANGKRARERADDAGPRRLQQIEHEAPRDRRAGAAERAPGAGARPARPPARRERAPHRRARSFASAASLGSPTPFKKTAGSDEAGRREPLLAGQANRLLASDVVWDDLFRALALVQLAERRCQRRDRARVERRREHGARHRASRWSSSSSGFAAPRPAARRPACTARTSSRSKAQPGDQTLVPGQLNTVTATTELAFDVTVQDSGDSQEVGIPVTLTIEQGTGKPIVKTQRST